MLVALIPARPLSLPLHVALILTALSLPIMVTRYLLATFDDSHPKLAEFPSRSSFDTLASAIEFVGTGATSGALLFCFLHVNWIAGVTFLVAGGLGFLGKTGTLPDFYPEARQGSVTPSPPPAPSRKLSPAELTPPPALVSHRMAPAAEHPKPRSSGAPPLRRCTRLPLIVARAPVTPWGAVRRVGAV